MDSSSRKRNIDCIARSEEGSLLPLEKRPRREHHIISANCNKSLSDSDNDNRAASHFVAAHILDRLSSLSDELLVRILHNLPLCSVLQIALVSRRFGRLSSDSELWKAHFYSQFVLPRALRIPGYRTKPRPGAAPLLRSITPSAYFRSQQATLAAGCVSAAVDWKSQYKLHHNWARGACAVKELDLGGRVAQHSQFCDAEFHNYGCAIGNDKERVFVKVANGIAVTADLWRGLRVWELKSSTLIVGVGIMRRSKEWDTSRKQSTRICHHSDENRCTEDSGQSADFSTDQFAEINDADAVSCVPTSLAVESVSDGLDIAVGLLNGGFEIWHFNLSTQRLARRFSHSSSSSIAVTGIAYTHPFVLTATKSVSISLYAFSDGQRKPNQTQCSAKLLLESPTLLTSLRSHTSRPPLALSVRRLTSRTVASIAYTLTTRQGWSIGLQDIHIKHNTDDVSDSNIPEIVASRLACTLPINCKRYQSKKLSSGGTESCPHPPRHSPLSQRPVGASHPCARMVSSVASCVSSHQGPMSSFMTNQEDNNMYGKKHAHDSISMNSDEESCLDDGPLSLCYTHPYLLATLPDNTLVFHLCTSNLTTLTLSTGIRLWGHTSGIGNAEITSRGKAVSVSTRGDELRVWELEGRPPAGQGESVAVRPTTGIKNIRKSTIKGHVSDPDFSLAAGRRGENNRDERCQWVGIDDEMVIVLKGASGGHDALLLYDFS